MGDAKPWWTKSPTLADRIKGARVDAGLSQTGLHKKIRPGKGRANHLVSCYELGRSMPSIPTLLRMCRVFRCRPDDLLCGLDWSELDRLDRLGQPTSTVDEDTEPTP